MENGTFIDEYVDVCVFARYIPMKNMLEIILFRFVVCNIYMNEIQTEQLTGLTQYTQR